MIALRKPEVIDFSEVELSDSVLIRATIPEILTHVRSYGKRRRAAKQLQKQFVRTWIKESDRGLMLPCDAEQFVKDYGLVPDLDAARLVLGNTAIIPRDTTHYYGLFHKLNNDTWGDGHGSSKRFVLTPYKKEYGILVEDPTASTGYLMARASVPIT